MRKAVVVLAAIFALSLSALAWPEQQTKVANPAPTMDDALRALRADLQSSRTDIIAKNVVFTSDQAAKFWPLYDAYQKEQNVIVDAQLKSIQQYVESFSTLDDASALALMTTHLNNDVRMVTLRQKWLAEFQKVLPVKVAARVIQIDRRLSLAVQTEISSRIPLIH